MMTYDEAIKYIHGVSNFFCKPGLERIRELCDRLDNPQNKLKFIHVAGTNGKGSFCAMTDSVLRQAGYKVGLYTSPFVREFNERMRVNGQNIPNNTLARITELVRAIAQTMSDKPTEFELITAIGFMYFLEEKCDIVILEVGMGGRLDATNIIGKPELAVITGIALDHTAFLGDSTEKIAYEKAGIIKENSVVVWGGDDPTAEAVIEAECVKKQSLLYKTDYSKLKIKSYALNKTVFDYKNRTDLEISLLGSYQPKNASIVLDALDKLSDIGLHVKEEDIRQGLFSARWPARFEIINTDPLVIFDGAHNAQGIEVATNSVKKYFSDERVIVVSGVLRDKEYEKIADNISTIASEIYTISPDNPRALPAEEYANCFKARNISALPCQSIHEAISLAMTRAKKENKAVLCLGSLYTYGEVISVLKS